jgi:hypothetical protein
MNFPAPQQGTFSHTWVCASSKSGKYPHTSDFKHSACNFASFLLALRAFEPQKWRQYVPPKRRWISIFTAFHPGTYSSVKQHFHVLNSPSELWTFATKYSATRSFKCFNLYGMLSAVCLTIYSVTLTIYRPTIEQWTGKDVEGWGRSLM